jgi:uncharacterized delta-60 repeat protein
MKQIIPLFIAIFLLAADLEAGNSRANAIAVDQNDTILLVGRSDSPLNAFSTQPLNGSAFALARYLPSGILDATFNPFGTVPGILQLRLSEEKQIFGGSLDSVNQGLTSVALTKANEIIGAGFYEVGLNSNVAVLKLTQDGSLDTTFNANGQLGSIPGLALIDVGKFIIPNNVANGVTFDTSAGVAIDSKGRIVVVGSSNNGQYSSLLVIRLTADGQLDQTFGITSNTPTLASVPGIFVYTAVQNTITSNITGTSVALAPDDSIVVGGTINGAYGDNSTVSSNFFIIKITPVGTIDTTFNATGTPQGLVQQTFQSVFSQAFALILDANQNIIIAGSSQQFFSGSANTPGGSLTLFAIARYTPLGNLDTTFNPAGLSLGLPGTVLTSISQNNDVINGLALGADGTILATGITNDGTNKFFATARYLPTGTLDPFFNSSGTIPGIVVTKISPVAQFETVPPALNSAQGISVSPNGQIYTAGFSFDGFQTNFTLLNYLPIGILNSGIFNSTGFISLLPGVVITPIGQSLTIQGNGVPLFITEDVSRVAPSILENFRQMYELVEPVITTDTRHVFRKKQIVLEGYASPHSLVSLYINGSEGASTSTRNTGQWYAILPPLLDGTYEINAVARDPISGVALSSVPVLIIVHTYVPKAPLIEKPSLNETFLTKTILVEGSAEPRSVVELSFDDTRRFQIQVSDAGRWRTSVSDLGVGNHRMVASVKSPEGIKSVKSEVSFSIDMNSEQKPLIQTPTNGFVIPTSEVLIEGRATPLTALKLYANNKFIKELPVDINGRWSYRMTNVDGAYELYVVSAKKGITSEKISGRFVLSEGESRGSSDLLRGYASPGGTIMVYAGERYIGMTKATKNGSWSFTPRDTYFPSEQRFKIVVYDARGTKQATLEKIV